MTKRETFLDGTGTSFATAMKQLTREDFQQPVRRVKWDAEQWELAQMLKVRCAMCGRTTASVMRLAYHHVTSGARKSDDAVLVLCENWLDGGCHPLVQSNTKLLPAVLYAMWKTQREELSWRRLAILHGRKLPKPNTMGLVKENVR